MTPLEPLPDHELLTSLEAARALGMDRKAFNYHLRRGRFPGAIRTPGTGKGPGRWRIPRAEVEVERVKLGVVR